MSPVTDSDQRPSGAAPVDASKITSATEFAAALAALTRRQVRGLADKSGVARSTISSWTTGQHLPNPNQIEPLRRLLTAVGVSEADQIEWAEAVVRVRRSPAPRGPSRADAAPFLGLEPFSEDDADRFFGREDVVASIVEHIQALRRRPSGELRIMFLVGASGEGKSSVLSAGVTVALSTLSGTTVSTTSPNLDDGSAFEGLGPDHTVIVDQLEEAFVTDQQGSAFLDTMIATSSAAGGPVVVAAIRSDFYHRLVGIPSLNTSLVEHQVVLSPMDEERMRRAIVEPARRAGVEIEPGLVEMMLNDVAPPVSLDDRPSVGVLPLLSHALLETWTRGDGRSLKVADYVSLGGLHGAIEKTAEVTFARLDPAGADAARDLFRRLVNITPDGLIGRRHAGLDEIATADDGTGVLTSVMWQFVAARLLTVEASTLTLSHEVLLRAWSRLRTWVAEDRDHIQLHRELSVAAEAWSESSDDEGALLAGGRLERARAWLTSPVGSRLAGPTERRFIEAGEERARRRTQQDRRRFRRVTALAVAASALAIVASVATIDASNNRHAAQDARVDAEVRDLVNRSRAAADPYLAAFYALEATQWTTPPLRVARTAWLDATERMGRQGLLRSGYDLGIAANDIGFRPDGQVLAVLDRDGAIHLIDVSSRGDVGQSPPAGSGNSIAWNPDGDHLATADNDGMIRLFDATDLDQPVRVTDIAVTTANDMAWSPDGSTIAVSTNEGLLVLLDGETLDAFGDPIRTGTASGQRVTWHPDGTLLATTNFDGAVMIIDRETAAEVAMTSLAGGVVGNGLAWNPAGTVLAVTSSDGFIRYFDPETLDQIGPPYVTGSSFALNVVWSPSGSRVATVNQDGALTIFGSVDYRRIGDPVLTGDGAGVAVAWSPSADLIVTTNDKGNVRFFDVPDGEVTASVYGARAALGPDGSTLVTTNFDDTIRVYDAASLAAVGSPEPAGGTDLTAIAWGPDGGRVAVGSTAGAVSVLDAERPSPRRGTLVGGGARITWIGWSADASRIVTVDDSGAVTALDADSLDGLLTIDLGTALTSGRLDPRSRTLAVTGVDGTLHLLAADDLEQRGDSVITGSAEATDVDWSPDGERLATVNADGAVELVDASDRTIDASYTLPDAAVRVAWSPSGDLIAVGTSTGVVWLFDARSLEPVGSLVPSDTAVTSLLWTPDGSALVSAHAGGFTVRTNSWGTSTACAALRQVLSAAEMDRLIDIPGTTSTCRAGSVREVDPIPATRGRTP